MLPSMLLNSLNGKLIKSKSSLHNVLDVGSHTSLEDLLDCLGLKHFELFRCRRYLIHFYIYKLYLLQEITKLKKAWTSLVVRTLGSYHYLRDRHHVGPCLYKHGVIVLRMICSPKCAREVSCLDPVMSGGCRLLFLWIFALFSPMRLREDVLSNLLKDH